MKYKTFKNNKFSNICFGCEPLGGYDWGEVDLKKIDKAINTSLELGLNFFDTADVYGLGLSEERLSKILGSKRHDLIIATKGGVSWKKKGSKLSIKKDISSKYIKSAVENSLRRLDLDILPVYYVHWPDKISSIEKTFEMLNDLQEKEKIGLIGCSNFSSKEIKKALKVSNLSLLQTPINILSGSLNKEIQDICSEQNIKIVAYNVLSSGLLTGKFSEIPKFPVTDRRHRLESFSKEALEKSFLKIDILKKKSKEKNMSLLELSLKWALSQKNVLSVITGIKKPQQIINNIEASI